MAMTHDERLLRVAELMDTVMLETFTLRTWSVRPAYAERHISPAGAPHHKGRLQDTTTLPADHRQILLSELLAAGHCGFAGCAVGHATQDPVLQAEGLTLNGRDGYFGPRFDEDADREYDWKAVEVFFGLTYHEAAHLFALTQYSANPEHDGENDSWHDPHPHQVAARIREFVASRSAA